MLTGGCEEQCPAYPDAIDYFDKALALEQADYKRYIKDECLFDIADFYHYLHYTKKAEAILKKTITDFNRSKDPYSNSTWHMVISSLGHVR